MFTKKRYIIETHRNPLTGEESETVTGERRYVTYAEIDEMPAADVRENIHGEWINHFDDLFPAESTQECSVCHAEQGLGMIDENFCPNCGAEMRERNQKNEY